MRRSAVLITTILCHLQDDNIALLGFFNYVISYPSKPDNSGRKPADCDGVSETRDFLFNQFIQLISYILCYIHWYIYSTINLAVWLGNKIVLTLCISPGRRGIFLSWDLVDTRS